MSVQKLPAIQLVNVGKRFAFTPDTPQSILETFVSIASRRGRKKKQNLWAVRDVSFDVMPGQAMGIIGRNGSGKSTVLKLISRILQPTVGQIAVRGRVSALLELGTGFHADLTGRENIFLNASVLGISQEEIEQQYESIVEFSELGDFIDMPVKHYSSGMYMRLGFSVAIHVNPDILIIDEILAVGDQSFQTKCLDRIMEMKRQGVTILIISHDMDTLRKLCTDLIWLEEGSVVMEGTIEEVSERYEDEQYQRVGRQLAGHNEQATFKRWGTQEIEITGVRFLDVAGEETTIFRTGDSLTIEMAYEAHRPIFEPEFGLAIYHHDGTHVNGPNSRVDGLELGEVYGSGVVRYHIAHLPLLPARYQLTAAVHDSQEPIAYDYHQQAYDFRVVKGQREVGEGLIAMESTWDWDPKSPSTKSLSTEPAALSQPH